MSEKDWKGKDGRGDEEDAGNRLQPQACWVVTALVVAGPHCPVDPIFKHELRGAEHMARRHEAHADIADPDLFAIADGLRMSRLAITRAHDGDRLRRGEHLAVAAARMVRDRTRVVLGKRVSVRVYLGCRRILKKNITIQSQSK